MLIKEDNENDETIDQVDQQEAEESTEDEVEVSPYEQIVAGTFEKDAVAIKDAVDTILSNKIADRLDALKYETAQSMFGGQKGEDEDPEDGDEESDDDSDLDDSVFDDLEFEDDEDGDDEQVEEEE